MAVIRVTSNQTFIALSSDTKPTVGVPAGARCWESDSGRWFIYDGTSWTLESPGSYEPDTFKIVDVAITAGTPATLWTPASGKIIRFLGHNLGLSAAAALEFQDSGAAGTIIFKCPDTATNAVNFGLHIGRGIKLEAADNTLDLDVDAGTITVTGTVWGIEED